MITAHNLKEKSDQRGRGGGRERERERERRKRETHIGAFHIYI